MRTVIIGGGLIGLCTAWALNEQGTEVTLIDKEAIPNPLSASVDRHRLIRYPYGSSLGYCRLVDAAYAGWEKLWDSLGESYYIENGTLALSRRADDWSDRSRETLDRAGIAYRLLAPQEMHQLYPFLSPDGIRWALYVEKGGVLLADRLVSALVEHLTKQGVRLRSHLVKQVNAKRQIVLDSEECLNADEVVIAVGAWTAKLLPQYATKIAPTRQVVVYLEPPSQFVQAWVEAPGIVDTGGDEEGYVIPPVAGTKLKCAAGAHNRSGDPDRERDTNEAEMQAVFAYFKQRFVGADNYRFLDAKTCYYVLTEDQNFIVEEIGDRVWVISGCSGHMFKFGAAMGLKVAETLLGRWQAAELTAWATGKV